MDNFSEEALTIFNRTEVACISIFSAEYLLKLISAPNVWGFIRTPLNLMDLLAVLPFFVEQFGAFGEMVLGETKEPGHHRELKHKPRILTFGSLVTEHLPQEQTYHTTLLSHKRTGNIVPIGKSLALVFSEHICAISM